LQKNGCSPGTPGGEERGGKRPILSWRDDEHQNGRKKNHRPLNPKKRGKVACDRGKMVSCAQELPLSQGGGLLLYEKNVFHKGPKEKKSTRFLGRGGGWGVPIAKKGYAVKKEP